MDLVNFIASELRSRGVKTIKSIFLNEHFDSLVLYRRDGMSKMVEIGSPSGIGRKSDEELLQEALHYAGSQVEGGDY